ncbi:MAG: hypothetical protein CMM01_05050 [Rhodopirellula sp.]|nr:hypothetical protein [Rhodopirellula sp.]
MRVQLRFLVGSCFLFLALYGFYSAEGDPPKALPLPDVEVMPLPALPPLRESDLENSEAFQAIRAAAEGRAPENQVNDPILGDVMQAIAERHRELGLDLDWDREAGPTGAAETFLTEATQQPLRSANAKTAEQLLKASRLLENCAKSSGDTADASRTDLVNRMRAEAVKLLSE